MRRFALPKSAAVNCLAFAPDGSRLAAGGHRATVRVWNLMSGSARPAHALKGTTSAGFVGFAGHPDRLVVAVAYNAPAVLFELPSMDPRPLGPAPRYCDDTRLSPDGARLARVERWRVVCRDPADGRELWRADYPGELGVRTRVRFGAGGARLFGIGRRATIRDAATGAEVGGFDLALGKHVEPSAADVSSDGRWLAVLGHDTLTVYDAADGRAAFAASDIYYGYGRALEFTPGGARLAVGRGGSGAGTDFFDTDTWAKRGSLDFGTEGVAALAFSPDGLLGAVGGGSDVVVFDLD